MWTTVAKQQRLLPIYGLQEMHDDKVFHPLPSFTQEPIRGRIPYCKFLYEATGQYGFAKGVSKELGSYDGKYYSEFPLADLFAFQHLIKVKEQQLVQIIKILQQGDKRLLKNFFPPAPRKEKDKKRGCIIS